jgi:large subunit ribosomal protein L2
MPVKSYNPTSPGRRFQTTSTFEEVTRSTPEKSLVVKLSQSGGRNNRGKITVRYRAGWHKKKYRMVDFRRDKIDPAVAHIENDRTAGRGSRFFTMPTARTRTIARPEDGNSVMSGPDADIAGQCAAHGIHTRRHRAANGSSRKAPAVSLPGRIFRQLLAREGEYATLRLNSGEVRKVRSECMATIGQVGNLDHENISIGKAGRCAGWE